MAIEVGSGNKAERAPANGSSSGGKLSSSSAGKSSGKSGGKASSSSASSPSRPSSSRPSKTSNTPKFSQAKAHDGGGNSGSRDTVAARAAGRAAPRVTPRAHDGGSSSSGSEALYDMLARDPIRGGKQFFPEMDAGYDIDAGTMRMLRVASADPFVTMGYHSRAADDDESERTSRMTGIGAMPGYADLASAMSLGVPHPATQSMDMRQMRNPVTNIRAHEQQVTPFPMPRMERAFGPVPADMSMDMRQMRNPVTNIRAHEQQVTPFPMDASMRPDPLAPPEPAEIYRGPFVPSGRDLGAMPDFVDMLSTLGAVDDVEFDPYAPREAAPYPRPSRERPVDPRIVQTLLGEAAGEGDLGIAGVAHTIMNRTERYGLDPLEVALERRGDSPYHQYSTWNSIDREGNDPSRRWAPGSPAFENAEEIFRDVRDNAYDFTGGATHYINPDLADPDWADPNVAGTEHLYDTIRINNHDFFPRVAPGERANIPSNPALAASIAAGGIGPDPIRVAQAPVPRMRPVSLGGIAPPERLNYGPAGVGIMPAMAGIENFRLGGYGNTQAAARGNFEDPTVRYALDATKPAGYNSEGELVYADGTKVPESLLPPLDPDAPERLAATPDWVPSPRQLPPLAPPVDIAADGVPVYADAPMGGGLPARQPLPGSVFSGKEAPIPMPRPDDRDMSVWDNVSSAAGKVFEQTAFGGALKAIFPEFYDDAGDAIMGLDDRGSGRGYGDRDDIPRSLNDGSDGNDYTSAPLVAAPPAPGGPPAGVVGPDGLVRDAQGLVSQLWWPQLRWPGADYDPGVDPEWDYLPSLASGGTVPGPSAPPPTSGLDPRLVVIMNAEDALKGQHSDPDAALQEFIEIFGRSALEALQQKVDGEAQSQPQSRMIRGPGGPKDDAVPAVINDVQQARLSDGEFVVPADAVAGAGEGDPQVGAERLTELSDRLSGRLSQGLRVDQVA